MPAQTHAQSLHRDQVGCSRTHQHRIEERHTALADIRPPRAGMQVEAHLPQGQPPIKIEGSVATHRCIQCRQRRQRRCGARQRPRRDWRQPRPQMRVRAASSQCRGKRQMRLLIGQRERQFRRAFNTTPRMPHQVDLGLRCAPCHSQPMIDDQDTRIVHAHLAKLPEQRVPAVAISPHRLRQFSQQIGDRPGLRWFGRVGGLSQAADIDAKRAISRAN